MIKRAISKISKISSDQFLRDWMANHPIMFWSIGSILGCITLIATFLTGWYLFALFPFILQGHVVLINSQPNEIIKVVLSILPTEVFLGIIFLLIFMAKDGIRMIVYGI